MFGLIASDQSTGKVTRIEGAEVLEALRERLERSRDEELETALEELVAIARDRWRLSP